MTQVSQSTIDFSVQAREVTLRSQAQNAQGGIVPGSTSEDPGQGTRGTDQTLELKAPTSPASPTTVGRTVELPKTPDRPGPSHRPSDQGEASAPSTPVASGPIRSPTPAPELSEAKPPVPVAQLAPEQVPTALQAMVQPGPEHNAAPADAGSTTAQASAPILAPEPLAPAAPSLAPARASDAAMRAAAALRVQRLPIGPDPLREIVKGADNLSIKCRQLRHHQHPHRQNRTSQSRSSLSIRSRTRMDSGAIRDCSKSQLQSFTPSIAMIRIC